MILIEQALDIIRIQNIQKTIIEADLTGAQGCYLAEEIISPFDLPSFDNSAMDGFAVSGQSDTYKIVGEIPAGDSSEHTLQPGEAMRIFTGARVPKQSTAVVMQEKTRVENFVLFIEGTVEAGQHIRRKGNELKAGHSVFSPGHFITPATVGMIGSLGMDKMKVYKKPDIRIITTGNELIPPGNPIIEGQIYEANSFALHAALRQYGFNSREQVHIRDDISSIREGISKFLDCSDVLLISGGISVGDYDFVRQACVEIGITELFYKVNQKPGKPLFFGRKQNRFIFALPGNPASSLTCFYIHVLPFLQKFSGAAKTGLKRIDIPAANDFEYNSDRPVFLKANIENEAVTILDGQSSSMIHTYATGNALVFLDGPQNVRKGDRVQAILI